MREVTDFIGRKFRVTGFDTVFTIEEGNGVSDLKFKWVEHGKPLEVNRSLRTVQRNFERGFWVFIDEELEGEQEQGETLDNGAVRTFSTGANRDTAEGKLDFEGFLSPTVLKRYAEYMHKNRKLGDGSLRDSDNWQKGIPKDVYMKSMYRHFFDVWSDHRGLETKEDKETNLCALLFNVMGMLHETLKEGKNE